MMHKNINETCVDQFYCESNMKALEESKRQIKEGKVIIKTIEELEKMENNFIC